MIRVALLAIALVGLLFVSNSWIGLEDHRALHASDASDYLVVYRAYPHLPDGSQKIVNESAHRFLIPYGVAMLGDFSGLSMQSAYRLVAATMVLAIVLSFVALLAEIKIKPRVALFVIVLLIFNPYTFRYPLAFPTMSADLIFVFGLTLFLHGLIGYRPRLLMASAVVMIVSRQTAAATVPIGLALLCWDAGWARWHLRYRVALGLAFTTVIFATFYLLAEASQSFATRATLGFRFIFGFIEWFHMQFDSQELLIFLGRGALAVAFPYLLFILWRKQIHLLRREIIIGTVLYLAVMVQPYLAGPETTGGNVQRLSLLGYTPLLIALAVALPEQLFAHMRPWRYLTILGLVIVASFHHILSWPGELFPSRAAFALFHFGCVGAVGLLMTSSAPPKAVIEGSGKKPLFS